MIKGTVLGLLLSASVAAGQSQPLQLAKIVWVNPDQLVMNCDEGKRDFAELQTYIAQKNDEGEALSKEVTALKQKLDIQRSKLTDEARMALQDQYEAKNTELQRFQQDTEAAIEKRRARIADRIIRKAQPVIEKFGKERGLSCVLYQNQVLAWADPSTNITDEIVKAFNAAYPVSPQENK